MQYDRLIFKLRDKLNEIGIDEYDDKLAYRDLEDAYETISMIATVLESDVADYPTTGVERCVIRLGTYNAYRNYTRLAEKQLGALPQGSPIIISYDILDVKNCLSLLFGNAFTDELVPVSLSLSSNPVVAGRKGISIMDIGCGLRRI